LNLAEELQRGPKLIANPEEKKITQARELYRRGYSMKGVAKFLGVNHATVAKWIPMRERRDATDRGHG